MADATIVGRVAIKVVPDTSGFRRELDRELEKATAGVNVKIGLDTKQLVQDAKKASAQADAALKTVTLEVELESKRSVDAGIARINAELSKLRSAMIDVDLNEASLEEAKARLSKIRDAHIKAEIELDNHSFTEVRRKIDDELSKLRLDPELDAHKVAGIKRQIAESIEKIEGLKLNLTGEISDREKERLKREIEKIKSELKVGIDELSAKTAQGRIALLARDRFVELKVRLQEKSVAQVATTLASISGARSVKKIFTDLFDGLKNLDKAVPSLVAVSLTLVSLSGYLLTATSNALAFGAGLASMAQAGLALPGILGGIALGAGATFAVFKDFNTILPEVAGKFHRLQDSMSEKFWARAKEPIREFINKIFPEFRQGMNKVSVELGGFFANLADSGQGILAPALDGMFKDLGDSVAIAGKHADSFLTIIRVLGRLGAGVLPRLAGWFGDISDNFSEWLSDNEANGNLFDWMNEGIQALKDFGGLLRYAGSTLKTLAQIAEEAGGSGLATMRDTLKSVSEVVKQANFRENLTNVFLAAHKAMSSIATGSGKQFKSLMDRVAKTLSVVLPSAGRAAGEALGAIFGALDDPRVQKSAIGFFVSIEKAISSLAPAMPAVAQGLAAIVDIAGALAETIAKTSAKIFQGLGPGLDSFSDGLVPLIQRLGNLVTAVAGMRVLRDVGRILGTIAKAISNLLKPVEMLTELFGKLPEPVKSSLSMLTALGVVVGASTWLGLAARAKVISMGASFASLTLGAKVAATSIDAVGVAGTLTSNRAAIAARGMSALKGAAGTGGLLAVADSANRADKAMGALQGALGGALVGSVIPGVGTALGAVIGGVGGGLLGYFTSGKKAVDVSKELTSVVANVKPELDGLKSTLDQVTGGITKMTKAQVAFDLQASGGFAAAGQLGVSTRDLVNGALGDADAYKRVMDAITGAANATEDYTFATAQSRAAGVALAESFGISTQAVGLAQGETRALAVSIANLSKLYPTLPQRVITKIEAQGGAETRDAIVALGTTVKLSPNQIDVLLRTAPGSLGHTKDDIASVQKDIKALNGKKATVGVEVKEAGSGPFGWVAKLNAQLAKTKVNVSPISRDLARATGLIADKATGQGKTIGSNLTQGFVSGISPTIAAAAARQMARAASDAANSELDINSPSRVFKKIGAFVTKGFALGIVGGVSEVTSKMDKLVALLVKSGHKGLANLAKRTRTELTALAKTWEQYQTKIAEVSAYVNQVADQIKQTGSPVEVNGGSFADIIANLQGATADAKAFAAVLVQLRNLKLNKTTMDQLAQAGPEAGLAAAQAIAAAGQAGVNELNNLQAELGKAALTSGNAAADVMFANGGNIVAGLLAGIQSQQAVIEAAMVKLAQSMVKTIKRVLKIHSPSKIFRDLGSYVGKGFVIGVEGQHANADFAIERLGGARPSIPSMSGDRAYGSSSSTTSNKTINYYAAPGSSLNAEEDLFAALRRPRG